MHRLGRIAALVVAVVLAHGALAAASPQDVINDYWDNGYDYTLDKPHSWQDLNQARTRFATIYPPGDTVQFSREVDRVIDSRELGIEPSGSSRGVVPTGVTPLWVKLAAGTAVAIVLAGIGASIWRRRRLVPQREARAVRS